LSRPDFLDEDRDTKCVKCGKVCNDSICYPNTRHNGKGWLCESCAQTNEEVWYGGKKKVVEGIHAQLIGVNYKCWTEKPLSSSRPDHFIEGHLTVIIHHDIAIEHLRTRDVSHKMVPIDVRKLPKHVKDKMRELWLEIEEALVAPKEE
jgi:hypothetical protein